jgi:hypothetical protein
MSNHKREKGWCSRNYFHSDGKRRFGITINGLCNECRKKESQANNPLVNPQYYQQIKDIIDDCNKDPGYRGVNIRNAFNKIDEIGGCEVLGLMDRDLKRLFQYSPTYLGHHKTCGRIEKIIGVPIGTYSVDDLYALFQFRLIISNGIGNTTNTNPEGVKSLQEFWKLAKTLAGSELPNRAHIQLAIEIMVKQGKAKKLKKRREARWEQKYKALSDLYSQLLSEHEKLKDEINRIQEGNYANQISKKKPFAPTVGEFHQKMSELYQEQTQQTILQTN